MKALKIIVLVIWGLITVSLFFYSSSLKQQVEVQKKAIDETLIGMSEMLDTSYVGEMLLHFKNEIDSLENEITERDSLISILKEK